MLLLAFCSIISVIGVKVNCEERPKRDQDDMVRNGIFLNARHTLTDDFKPSKGPVKPSSSSIRLLRNSDRLGGLLNSTRGPREREPRLVVLPRDPADVNDKRKQICSDEHCLAEGYDKLRRPHLGVKKPLRVGIELDGIRILEVEDQTFSVSIQMYLGVRWTEPRMSGPVKQEEEDYDYYQDYYYYFSNDSFVALDTKFVRHLWIPDLYVYNMKYGSRVLKDFDGKCGKANQFYFTQHIFYNCFLTFRPAVCHQRERDFLPPGVDRHHLVSPPLRVLPSGPSAVHFPHWQLRIQRPKYRV